MLRHDVGDGISLCLLLNFTTDPCRFGPGEEGVHVRFSILERPIVEIGCVVEMSRLPFCVDLNVEHSLGYDPPVPTSRDARVLNCMFEKEQDAWAQPGIAVVDQGRSSAQQIAVSFQREVDGCIEKGVPGTDESSQCLTLRGYQRFFKSYALVTGQDRFTESNQPIAIAYRRRDMGNLISPRLALLRVAAELPEGFKEEGFDIVGLKAARFGAFHLLPNAMDFSHVHRVVRQGALLY